MIYHAAVYMPVIYGKRCETNAATCLMSQVAGEQNLNLSPHILGHFPDLPYFYLTNRFHLHTPPFWPMIRLLLPNP